jgi:hypothetical protein
VSVRIRFWIALIVLGLRTHTLLKYLVIGSSVNIISMTVSKLVSAATQVQRKFEIPLGPNIGDMAYKRCVKNHRFLLPR